MIILNQADPVTALRFARKAAEEVLPEYFEVDETGKPKFAKPKLLSHVCGYAKVILEQMRIDERERLRHDLREPHTKSTKESSGDEELSSEQMLKILYRSDYGGNFIKDVYENWLVGKGYVTDGQDRGIRKVYDRFLKEKEVV